MKILFYMFIIFSTSPVIAGQHDEGILLFSPEAEYIELNPISWEVIQQDSFWKQDIYSSIQIEYSKEYKQYLVLTSNNYIHFFNQKFEFINSLLIAPDHAGMTVNFMLSPMGKKFTISYFRPEEKDFVTNIYDAGSNKLLHKVSCDSTKDFSHFINEEQIICGMTPVTDGVFTLDVGKGKKLKSYYFNKVVNDFKDFEWLNPLHGLNGRLFLAGRKNNQANMLRDALIFDLTKSETSYHLNNLPDAHCFLTELKGFLLCRRFKLENISGGLSRRINENKWFFVNLETKNHSKIVVIPDSHYIGYSVLEKSFLFVSGEFVYFLSLEDQPSVNKKPIPEKTIAGRVATQEMENQKRSNNYKSGKIIGY